MAAPTTPTKTRICTQALKRVLNGGTPNSTELTNAEDYGLEKVKRDIMMIGKTWRPLIKTAFKTLVVGKSHYDNPSDFEADFSISFMYGSHTGQATAGAAGSITLAAAEDISVARAEGKYCFLTAGTGADQARVVYDYSTTTKVCTVSENWSTTPDNTSVYMICDQVRTLTPMRQATYQQNPYPGRKGTPKRWANIESATYGQIALYPVPDVTAGIMRKYYADLMLLDITEGSTTLYTAILTRWAGVFEQGVYVWKLGEDDDRYSVELETYQSMLISIMKYDMAGFEEQAAKNAVKQVGAQ